MDLFIESPQRARERAELERRMSAGGPGAAMSDGRECRSSVGEIKQTFVCNPDAAASVRDVHAVGSVPPLDLDEPDSLCGEGRGLNTGAGRSGLWSDVLRGRRASCEHAVMSAPGFDSDKPDGAGDSSRSVADTDPAEAYRAELAYDRTRARRRKLRDLLRLLALFVLVPLAVVVVFVAAYVGTYILNGATPEQVASALLGLLEQAREHLVAAISFL